MFWDQSNALRVQPSFHALFLSSPLTLYFHKMSLDFCVMIQGKLSCFYIIAPCPTLHTVTHTTLSFNGWIFLLQYFEELACGFSSYVKEKPRQRDSVCLSRVRTCRIRKLFWKMFFRERTRENEKENDRRRLTIGKSEGDKRQWEALWGKRNRHVRWCAQCTQSSKHI